LGHRENAIATGRLGLIERIVGALGGLVESVVAGRARRDTTADREPDFATRAADDDLVYRLADPLADEIGATIYPS